MLWSSRKNAYYRTTESTIMHLCFYDFGWTQNSQENSLLNIFDCWGYDRYATLRGGVRLPCSSHASSCGVPTCKFPQHAFDDESTREKQGLPERGLSSKHFQSYVCSPLFRRFLSALQLDIVPTCVLLGRCCFDYNSPIYGTEPGSDKDTFYQLSQKFSPGEGSGELVYALRQTAQNDSAGSCSPVYLFLTSPSRGRRIRKLRFFRWYHG